MSQARLKKLHNYSPLMSMETSLPLLAILLPTIKSIWSYHIVNIQISDGCFVYVQLQEISIKCNHTVIKNLSNNARCSMYYNSHTTYNQHHKHINTDSIVITFNNTYSFIYKLQSNPLVKSHAMVLQSK